MRRNLNTNQNQKQTNLLVSRHREPKKLHEHRNSTQFTRKGDHKSKTTGEINRKIQMFQQQQD